MSKVKITGDASGTGTFTLTSPNSNTSRELVLPDNAGTLVSTGDQTVLQVVQDTFTSTFLTTSQTSVDTGLAVTITPRSTSSKILIMAKVDMAWDALAAKCFIDLTRGDTPIFIGDTSGNKQQVTSAFYVSAGCYTGLATSVVYEDSPATTNATTYKIRMRRADPQGTVGLNRGIDGWTDSSTFATSASSIIAMEISG